MAHDIIIPPALNAGDTIGIMAPSSFVEDDTLDAIKNLIDSLGYSAVIHPQSRVKEHQSAGTGAVKAAAFHDLLGNPSIKAIFCARGGNRAATMLEHIKFDLARLHPKIVMGYSDVTILLNALYSRAGLVTFHGPVAKELPIRANTTDIMAMLGGATPVYNFQDSTILTEGVATGRLVGGNLSLLQAMCGTPYQPKTKGAIIFIEDIGDEISRYDRMLTHLKHAGWLDHAAAIIAGEFSDTKDNPDRPFGFNMRDLITAHTADLGIPVIMNAPFGHGSLLPCLPIGGMARLTAVDDTVSLELTTAAVSV